MSVGTFRYKGFDGLRGVCILLVIVSHLGIYAFVPDWLRDRIIPMFAGSAGVTLFFVLSGFLITSLLIKEKCASGRISIRNFIARRFFRLAPALLVFLSVVGCLMAAGKIQSTSTGFVFAFLYLYNFVPSEHYTSELAHTWSLAIEEQFYLMWPWLVACCSYNKLFRFVLVFLCLCALVRMGMGAASTNVRWTVPGMAPVLIGCGLSIYHYVALPQKWFRMQPGNTAIGIAALLLWSLSLWLPGAAQKFIFLPQTLGFGLMVYWIFLNPEAGIVRLLERKPLVYLGTISYGIYLWQGLFVTNGPSGKLWVQHFPQNVFFTFTVAILSYHSLEKYFLQFKEKKSSLVTA